MSAVPIHCPQCEAVVINGIPCHETGCPLAHIDLRTDDPKLVECFECGGKYPAENLREYKNPRRVCPDCQHPEYAASFEETGDEGALCDLETGEVYRLHHGRPEPL